MNEMARNAELLSRLSEGDESALDELVVENTALVRSIAARFLDRGVEFDDLTQIGMIGMIKAARSFDISLGNAFSTYAVPLITGEIRRYLRDDGPIRVSRRIKAKAYEIMKAKEAFIKENGREPRLSELSELCSMGSEELVFTLGSTASPRSLSEPIGENEDGELADFISSGEQGIEELTDKIALREAIRGLSDEQKKILQLRYYRELSQAQTGKILGLTQVKVSREEKKIMTLLRAAL